MARGKGVFIVNSLQMNESALLAELVEARNSL